MITQSMPLSFLDEDGFVEFDETTGEFPANISFVETDREFEALDEVDRLLKPFGLQVMVLEVEKEDKRFWRIAKIDEPEADVVIGAKVKLDPSYPEYSQYNDMTGKLVAYYGSNTIVVGGTTITQKVQWPYRIKMKNGDFVQAKRDEFIVKTKETK